MCRHETISVHRLEAVTMFLCHGTRKLEIMDTKQELLTKVKDLDRRRGVVKCFIGTM